MPAANKPGLVKPNPVMLHRFGLPVNGLGLNLSGWGFYEPIAVNEHGSDTK
jgi:hypothetical protein